MIYSDDEDDERGIEGMEEERTANLTRLRSQGITFGGRMGSGTDVENMRVLLIINEFVFDTLFLGARAEPLDF
jgi:hypothetical protein